MREEVVYSGSPGREADAEGTTTVAGDERAYSRLSLVAVLTASNKPGCDVTLESLKRQDHPGIIWVFADNLYELRAPLIQVLTEKADIPTYHFKPPAIKPGYRRNLAAAYNEALRWCRNEEVDLMISLQDYIWIPPDGVSRFVAMAEKFPNCLLTGICSISLDPEADAVVDPEGLYTIFGAPYTDAPDFIDWEDSRAAENYRGQSGYVESNPIEWENNFSAIPKTIIDSGIDFDEDFDKGVAYENQGFAFACRERLGTNVILDLDNRAISLPHKRYPFGLNTPTEVEDLPFNDQNRILIEEKFGAPR